MYKKIQQSRGCAARRRGAAIVETALVLPVFLLFVIGIMEIGRGFMMASLLHNAARAGCRTGILAGKSNTDIEADVKYFMDRQAIMGFQTHIFVNGVETDVTTAKAGDEITVVVSAPFSSWLPGNSTFTQDTANLPPKQLVHNQGSSGKEYLKGSTLAGQYVLYRE